MVYKIGNISDLESIAITDANAYALLSQYARLLSYEYGEDRNVDTDDGGYVLYAAPGSSSEDIKAYFDYTKHVVESADRFGSLVVAMWIIHNEFVVLIVMSEDDAPIEIIKEID